jgi:hypothetical protein
MNNQPVHTNQQVIIFQGKLRVKGCLGGQSTDDELARWYSLCHLSFGPSGYLYQPWFNMSNWFQFTLIGSLRGYITQIRTWVN